MQRFQRAVELYQEEDFAVSLIEFKKAYDLAPSYKLLYQIGQVFFKLRDYAGAYQAFEQYLAQGGAELSRERRTEVEEEIQLLKSRTGRIEIHANVFGAQVTIDDVSVGTIPLENSVLVSVGDRRVTVTAEGRQPVTQVVRIAGQELRTMKFDLPALATNNAAAPVLVGPSMTAWSWVGIGTAAALGVGATITGVGALSAEKDLSNMTYAGSQPNSAVKDQRSKVKGLALATDILGGAAIVTLGATLIATFARDPSAPAEQPPSSDKAARRFVQPTIGFGSIGVTGEF